MLQLIFSSFKTYILLSLICTFVSTCLSQPIAPGKDSLYYRNPENFIAKKVLEGKIVMLGDVSHHYSDVYNSLLIVLYELSDEVSSNQNKPVKLTLILEMGPSDAQALSDFVTGGTLEQLVDRFSPDLFYEDMEYYSNLRRFYEFTKQKSNLEIQIKGFEPMNADPTPEIIKSTGRQLDSLFMIRDSILSTRIFKFIDENPDSQTLIFYGSRHLFKGLTSKPTNFGTCGDCLGYFMADYLKRYFGDKRVVTFDQKWLNPDYFRGTTLAESEFSDIIAPASSIDSSKLLYTDRYDYFVLWRSPIESGIPKRFEFVFSKRSIDKHIEFLKTSNQYNGNERAEVYVNSVLFYLNFICCSDFKTPNDAINSNISNSYNGMELLKSDCFKNKIYEVYAHSKSKNLLKLLGFRESDIEIGSTTDTLKKFNEIWDANLQQMIFLNQVGVMWIGYPDEQKMAKEFLKQYSGIDSDDPAVYFEWFRENSRK